MRIISRQNIPMWDGGWGRVLTGFWGVLLGLVINMRLTWRRHMTSRLPATDKAEPDKPELGHEKRSTFPQLAPSLFPALSLSPSLSGQRVSQFWRFVYTARKTCSLSRANADEKWRFRASLKVVRISHTLFTVTINSILPLPLLGC